MKKQKGFTSPELIVVLIGVFGIGAWIVNAIKLASCDFESPYKCEVVHAIGTFVPPAAMITVWFADDDQ